MSPAAPATAVSDELGICHAAFALRVLLAVNAGLALGALALARDGAQALALLGPALLAGVAGSLLWLVVACALQRRLARATPRWRVGLRSLLGAAVALATCAPLAAWQLIDWHALRAAVVPLSGAALALPAAAWLELRQRARRPADASARLAELQSRIRPHFLFNALNTALALVRIDPERAERVLEDLAELFRFALAERGASITLAEELELARRYLEIEQVRFGERLRLSWELDAGADSVRVPPLVLQPLVENAVRHGIEPAAEGGVIRVRTQRRLGTVEIAVDNTLSPHSPARPGHGIALANVRERLALLHDLAAEFDARRLDGWYRVRIVVPTGNT